VPGRQKTGIGTALIREALQKMRKKGALGIVLVGDPAFYNGFGFTAVPGLVYKGSAGSLCSGIGLYRDIASG
jgi:putative acetyltransferase